MEPITLQAAAAILAEHGRMAASEAEHASALWHSATVTAVCTDSRAVAPGCLFFALKGPNFDGHRFVRDALAQGAVGAVVERGWAQDSRFGIQGAGGAEPGTQNPETRPFLLAVDDTLLALGDLARGYRSRFEAPVVGITGSVGKTSTKEMAAAILAQRGPTVATRANFNNEIGMPLTLFDLESRHAAVVLEMAMRGAGQIRYLAEIARPQIGVVTNIGTAHLELLGSREAIARAKGELLEALPETGAAILPAADRFLPFLRSLSRAPVTTFGLDGVENPDVAVTGLLVGPTESRFVIEGLGVRVPVLLRLPGRHNALNAAAAAAAALHAGADAAAIAVGLESCRLPEMRMQVLATASGLTVLNDAYNASPDSMAAALNHLREMPGERHVAVLGDMLELGEESEAGHREAGAHAANVDLLLTVGERSGGIAAGAIEAGLPPERVRAVGDAAEALAYLKKVARPGDVVLVKGSRGMRLERVAQGLQDA